MAALKIVKQPSLEKIDDPKVNIIKKSISGRALGQTNNLAQAISTN